MNESGIYQELCKGLDGHKAKKTSVMLRLVDLISSLLQLLPVKFQNKLFEITLKYIPISLIKIIPCSYSAYIKNYKPKKGDVIIDCGAHIGNCTILFSRMIGKDGLIIALEPFKESFRILKERTKYLKSKILVVNKGVWCEKGKVSLKVFSDHSYSCKIVDKHQNISGQDICIINCITIDDLINEIKPVRLDIIKMDIEGAEIEALKGAVNTIKKYSPRFAIASYHVKNNEKTCLWIEKFLMKNGYTVKTCFPPHLTTYGEKTKTLF